MIGWFEQETIVSGSIVITVCDLYVALCVWFHAICWPAKVNPWSVLCSFHSTTVSQLVYHITATYTCTVHACDTMHC